jgi:hypothetical protein
LKTQGASRRRISDVPLAEALSAVVAHELNNIAVPIRGFIELASATAAPEELVHQTLDEVQIGMGRIAALAYDLQSLAQIGSVRSSTSLGECLAPADHNDAAVALRSVWACNPLTRVNVDREHVRRAIHSMAALAGGGSLHIAESAMKGSTCAACGRALPRRSVLVKAQARSLRPAITAIRAPFAAEHKLRSAQRVTIAALVHCTHLAGAHVMAHAEATSLSIVLPA